MRQHGWRGGERREGRLCCAGGVGAAAPGGAGPAARGPETGRVGAGGALRSALNRRAAYNEMPNGVKTLGVNRPLFAGAHHACASRPADHPWPIFSSVQGSCSHCCLNLNLELKKK